MKNAQRVHDCEVPYYQDESTTLYLGDCNEVLESLLEPIDLLLTDPPYGIEFRSNYRQATEKFDAIVGDGVVDGAWLGTAVDLLKDDCAAYVFTRWDVLSEWTALVAVHLDIKGLIVWHKPGGGIGDLEGTYLPNHEEVIYATKGRHILRGKRTSDVWTVQKDAAATYRHPTQKPLGVMTKPIVASTDAGGLVLDPFAGSGSSLVAAKAAGRRAVGIEIDEGHCETIVSRLAQGSLFAMA